MDLLPSSHWSDIYHEYTCWKSNENNNSYVTLQLFLRVSFLLLGSLVYTSMQEQETNNLFIDQGYQFHQCYNVSDPGW